MSGIEWTILMLAILVLALLVHSAFTIGDNPNQNIKVHEDLVGPLPKRWNNIDKLRFIGLMGLAPSGRYRLLRIAGIVLSVLVVVIVVQYLR